MHPTANALPPSPPMSTLRRDAEHDVPADVDAMSEGSGPIRINDLDNDGPIEGVSEGPTPQERLAELDVRVRAFVTQHPAAAVLGAITAGFVVGRLLSRR